MAFDPTKPVAGSEIDAGELNRQFNGLKDLIDALTVQVAALQAQLATRAPRVDSVAPMDIPFHDPVSRDDMTPVMDKFNELLTAAQQP